MGKPKAVKQGASRAREMIKQQQEAEAKAIEAESEAPPDLGSYLSPEPETAPVEQPSSQQPSGDEQLRQENERLQQRLRVLQGKYDGEVPRLQQRLKELEQKIEAASDQNTQQGSGVTLDQAKEKLYDEFPRDVVDTLLGVIGQGGNKVNPDEVAGLKRRVEQNEVAAFRRELARRVPNWMQIDSDPAFNNGFLNEMEGRTGQPKGHFYVQASQSYDVDTCAGYLEDFIAAKGKPKAPPVDAPRPTGDNVPSSDNGTDAKTFKRSEINRFERAFKRGEYRGKEDEVSRVRRMFRNAAAEGRVIEDMGGL